MRAIPSQRRRTLVPLLLLALLLVARADQARAQDRPLSLPAGWHEEVLVSNLGAPTAFALAPDGRIYVALKPGRVKVIDKGVLQGGAFIDLTAETNTYADRGLLGITLHPDFPEQPWVYLAYVWDPPGAPADESGRRSARVVRVSADPDNLNVALADTLTVLVGAGGTVDAIGDLVVHDRAPFACSLPEGGYAEDCLPVDGPSHTVDSLLFGPDGALYISAGDATLQPGANVRAQSLESLAGKVLRVDGETGAGLPDNPWFDGEPFSNQSRLFARGMRNPFRFGFSASGDLILGDVGAESWEELNRVPPGANLGWPCYEGPMRARSDGPCAGLTASSLSFAPYSYPHEGEYSAAIAGDYLPVHGLSEPWAGAYVFGDHNRAALLWLAAGWEEGSAEAGIFASNAIAPVQISTGEDGALYVLSFVTGSLSRITWTGGDNRPPIAQLSASRVDGELPLTVDFSSDGSSDPDGDPLTARWDFGDGASSDEFSPSHTYDSAGVFEVRLTVTDPAGASRTVLRTVSAGNAAPVVTLTKVLGPSVPSAGDELQFAATADDPGVGALAAEDIRWSGRLFHNEHEHVDYASGSGPTLTLRWDDHGDNTWLEICATVADLQGREGSSCVQVGRDAPRADEQETLPDTFISEPVTETLETIAGASEPVPSAVEPAQEQPAQQGLLLERWAPVDGAAVADLVTSDMFATAPDFSAVVGEVRLSGNGKDYGQRLRGWFLPEVGGPVRFWLAADDGAELWLGQNEDPKSAVLIASVPGWSRIDEYDKYPEQSSVPVEVVAGERYYIEILHKQADQRDGLSVEWLPPEDDRQLLAGPVLEPWK